MASKGFLSFNKDICEPTTLFAGLQPDEDEDQLRQDAMRLKDTWWLWEQAAQSGGAYADTTKQTVSFKTAQEFWEVWNGVPQPSELLEGKRFTREQSSGAPLFIDAIMIFKDGVKPEWEDPANANGGHFQVQLKIQTGGPQIDEYWNNVVLAMVGATLEPYGMITGARLVDKLSAGKGGAGAIRIELWYKRFDNQTTAQHMKDVDELRKNFERCLWTRLDGSTNEAMLAGQKFEQKSHSSGSKH